MIIEYQLLDGSRRHYGWLMSDGPLSQASGQLVRGWHHRCFHITRKRAIKGDPVNGRVLPGAPTAYEISEPPESGHTTAGQPSPPAKSFTLGLTQRLQAVRALAREMGTGVGDAAVWEAMRAREHNGPYRHTHDLPVQCHQLPTHLRYAHGLCEPPACSLPELHARTHATAALADTVAARDADPGHTEPVSHDWRTQVTADVQDLRALPGGTED